MATSITPGGNAMHCNGERDLASCEIISDPCSVCKMQINEVTGEPIILAGKKFHEACLKCKYCRKRVRPGWTIVHPAGLLCDDVCMQTALQSFDHIINRPSSCFYAKNCLVIDRCILCNMPINEDRLETWIDCDGIAIHRQCFKCEACGTPPPPKGVVIMCAERFWCDDDCIRSANEKAVKAYYQPTKEAHDEARGGNDDSVNGGDVSDQCGVCNKPISEAPGEQSISCGEKQFHQSCFKCTYCETCLEPGWLKMHSASGLFCNRYPGSCIRRFGERAMQVSYKPGCNIDNNFIVNSNCLVCKMPINKEHLETSVNCSGSIIHQQCFKCKACNATPPPEGEIMALSTWFFCDDDCIRSFGEKAIDFDYQAKEAEDEMRGESEEEMFHPMEAAASPAIAAEDPSVKERSSRKKPPK